MNKLELKHLSPYLPYGLKILRPDGITILQLHGLVGDLIVFREAEESYGSILGGKSKPILRPMSDFIDVVGKCMNELNIDIGDQIIISDLATRQIGVDSVPYRVIEIMSAEHIDFHRLIDQGLAIDINSLNKEKP